MGADGEAIFSSLLLDCGLFISNNDHKNTFVQISGFPIHDLCLQRGRDTNPQTTSNANHTTTASCRTLNQIVIVRSRMLYSKPSLNHNGEVSFGLKPVHVLNKVTRLSSEVGDPVLLQYIFPRQFKLHNVFTFITDRTETVQPFKDYSFRRDVEDDPAATSKPIPKRLRHGVLHLVQQIQPRLSSVANTKSLSPKSTVLQTQIGTVSVDVPEPALGKPVDVEQREGSFLPYATPTCHVVAFCQATIKRLLPSDTFGRGSDGVENWRKVLDRVDRFACMRRFETISMHELVQGLKIKAIRWLAPEHVGSDVKVAITDVRKRAELLNEFIYYMFDSLLIPLVATNFYVTESGIHRNKLLFFRHDVWKRLCQPCLRSAMMSSLTPVASNVARQILRNDQLGYSTIRLLPKEAGTRPIANLSRRVIRVVNGRRFLAPSINTRLSPIFSIFNYEKEHNHVAFNQCAFSIHDLHRKLAGFKAQIGMEGQPTLYFAKVDIRSAFDSIPQQQLLDFSRSLFQHEQYHITRHAESRIFDCRDTPRTSVKFSKAARPVGCPDGLLSGEPSRATKNAAIYSNLDQHQFISKQQAEGLLRRHIQANLIRIDRKYYRQTEGIPQGSVLSSMLCTFFYNEFERTRLSFLQPRNSVLLRIIDDFLLISTQRSEAIAFVEAMKSGDTDYGLRVHPEKSLVNFDMVVEGVQIPRLFNSTSFPFCGLFVDTETLDVSKNRVRKDNVIANTLTIDRHGQAGVKLKRRVAQSLRIQLQSILLDGTQNSSTRVLQTLIECFQESAMKLHQHCASMPRSRRPGQKMLIGLIEQLINVVFDTMKQYPSTDKQYMTRHQVCCIAAAAIMQVLRAKNASYPQVLVWLHDLKVHTQYSMNQEVKVLDGPVAAGSRAVKHYVY
ncbi:Telomerase reverse transcriptase [Lithohypha guttulata]|nr:Telomerase reverse transcriptase [Lithohypha guttulata]